MASQRRWFVAAVSVLAHALVLILLLRPGPGSTAQPNIGTMSVTLYSGAAIPAVARPPAPELQPVSHTPVEAKPKPADAKPPSDIEPQFIAEHVDEPDPIVERDPQLDTLALAVAAAASSAAGQPCQLTTWLQQALQAAPQVQAALLQIPRPTRSVANAIMLWNGAWIEPQTTASTGVLTLHQAVAAGIRAAPAACREQVIQGPELIILLDGAGATVLAIGSGEWRWADLLDPAYQRTAISGPSSLPWWKN